MLMGNELSAREIIDLRSDTVTLPTEEMLKAIRHAALGDDVFREDPTVNRLEQLAAEKMDKEAVLLVTSGTQANLVALMCNTKRGQQPDAVVSQAIADGYVTVYSLEDTHIDELISSHETNNIKVNESYYSISIAYGDQFPPIWVAYLHLISLVILPLSIIALTAMILLKAKARQKQKHAVRQNLSAEGRV